MSDLPQKGVIVVTGAAKGIGEATARAFAREGATIAVLDLDERGAQVAESVPDAKFFKCDVSDAAIVEATFNQISRLIGPVRVLVNNAGIQTYGTVTATIESDWDRVMNVNLKSAYLCAKHAIPMMLQRGGGVVINVASVQAFQSQPNVAAYATSKAALLGLTRSIAVDYAPHVRCVAVCPGGVDTPMLHEAAQANPMSNEARQHAAASQLIHRLATPQEIADLIVYLASDRAAFITGEAIRIDGGLGIALPGQRAPVP
jgi:NAD(P)-dependent dehydrogenase (short-subunit alcohol dehydrogenase family)